MKHILLIGLAALLSFSAFGNKLDSQYEERPADKELAGTQWVTSGWGCRADSLEPSTHQEYKPQDFDFTNPAQGTLQFMPHSSLYIAKDGMAHRFNAVYSPAGRYKAAAWTDNNIQTSITKGYELLNGATGEVLTYLWKTSDEELVSIAVTPTVIMGKCGPKGMFVLVFSKV